MKVTPLPASTKFCDKRFSIEVSGLELSLLKFILSCVSTRHIDGNEMYHELNEFSRIDYDSLGKKEDIQDLVETTKESFVEISNSFGRTK